MSNGWPFHAMLGVWHVFQKNYWFFHLRVTSFVAASVSWTTSSQCRYYMDLDVIRMNVECCGKFIASWITGDFSDSERRLCDSKRSTPRPDHELLTGCASIPSSLHEPLLNAHMTAIHHSSHGKYQSEFPINKTIDRSGQCISMRPTQNRYKQTHSVNERFHFFHAFPRRFELRNSTHFSCIRFFRLFLGSISSSEVEPRPIACLQFFFPKLFTVWFLIACLNSDSVGK